MLAKQRHSYIQPSIRSGESAYGNKQHCSRVTLIARWLYYRDRTSRSTVCVRVCVRVRACVRVWGGCVCGEGVWVCVGGGGGFGCECGGVWVGVCMCM